MKMKLPIRWVVVALALSPLLIAGGIYLINHFILTRAMDEMTAVARNQLLDPDGGRIRNRRLISLFEGNPALHIYEKSTLDLCGEISGKNAFGAYVGYKKFRVSAIPDDKGGKIEFLVTIDSDRDNSAEEYCSNSNNAVVLSKDEFKQ